MDTEEKPVRGLRKWWRDFLKFWNSRDIRSYWTTVWIVFLIALSLFGIVDNIVLLPLGFGVSFTTYGLIVTSHTILQFLRALINIIRIKGFERLAERLGFQCLYSVLSFGHEEAEKYYRKHLKSIGEITDHWMQGAIFMADGKSRANMAMVRWFHEEFPEERGGFYLELPEEFEGVYSEWSETQQEAVIRIIQSVKPQPKYIFLMQAHGGKRKIMYTAMKIAKRLWPVKTFGVTDSDTVIEPNAYRRMAMLFVRQTVGAICGFVGILNVGKKNGGTHLSRLSNDRYWRAFMIERGAQSASGSVICVSGPLGMYRVEAVFQILEDWYKSTFLGVECTYGDDRELTRRVQGDAVNPDGKAYEIFYTPYAKCWTETPTTIKRWVTQQTRWMKSANREAIFSFLQIGRVAHPFFYTYELIFQQFLSLLLIVGIVSQLFQVLRQLVAVFLAPPYSVMSIAMCFLPIASLLISVGLGGFLRGLAGFFICIRSNERWERLICSTEYGYLFMRYLLFARIDALLHIYDASWGTSSRAELVVPHEDSSLQP